MTITKRPGTKGKGSKPISRRQAVVQIPVHGDRKKPGGLKASSKRGDGKRDDSKSAGARKGPRRGADKAKAIASNSPTMLDTGRDISDTRALAMEMMDAALDKKALMPVLIDVSGMASYTDFIGIVSGTNDRQVDAIASHISTLMKSRGRYVLGQEGGGNGRWTLLDFGSIVIHVFYHPIREFYDLESLWIDAPRVKIDIPPEARITQPDALYGAL